MGRHAEKQHVNEWKKINAIKPSNQPEVSTYFEAKQKPIEKYPVKSAKRKRLNRKLANFIAKDMRPIAVVRNKGFRDLINELDPRWVLPSAATLRGKIIPKIYSEVMTTLQGKLDNVTFVTMTTDGWTSIAGDKYNAFTVHYIDWSEPEPKLVSKILECAPYDNKGTGIELEKEIRRVTEKFNITEKVVLTVADNASDIQLALNLFGAPRIGCVAHTLNLAAKHGMEKCEAIESLKLKLTKIVRTTKVSSGAKNALIQSCKTVGIEGPNVLISFVPTRWNSVFLMFERALKLKNALILYFVDHKIDKANILNAEDWKLIEDFTKILKPLYFVTTELSSEKHSTLSKVIPMVSLLYQHYSPQPEIDQNPIAKIFRGLIYDELKFYFQEIETETTYSVATVYDPRFKNLPSVFSTTVKAQQAVRLAKTEALEIAHANDEATAPDDNDNEIEETSTSKDDDFWALFDFKPVKPNKRSKTSDYFKDCIDLEMRKYLSLPKLERQNCPIKWWKTIGSKQFPQLFECAKKYQCMLATSVPSERVFSNAGQVLNKKRSRLGKNTANVLITLHSNLE